MRDILEAVRDKAIKSGVQFMDVRLFNALSSNVTIQDKKADKIGQNIRYGAGIRVLVEGAWGFASTNIINKQTLFVALENAIKMATLSKKKIDSPGVITKLDPIEDIHVYKVKRDPRRVPAKEKLDLVTKFEARALDYGKSKIVNSIVQYMDYVIKETICNTVGTYIENETTRTFIAAVMTAQEGNVRQIAYKIRGGLSGFEFAETIDPDDLSVKAAKTAISLLKAELPPAGKFPVIFHPSVTGLFVHEAFGHNAEGDLIHGGEYS